MDDGLTFADRLTFIRNVDAGLSDHLERAAQLLHDDSVSAAVALRAFGERVVREHLQPEASKRRSFHKLLCRSKAEIPPDVYSLLDRLRQIGNDGAHPDQGIEVDDTPADGIQHAWAIAVWLHEKDGGRPEDVPVFKAPTQADSYKVFRDVFLGGPYGNGDPKAKYHVAKAIQAQSDKRLRALHEGKIPSATCRLDELKRLYTESMHEIPAARTELAKLWLDEKDLSDERKVDGFEMFKSAAEADDPEGLFMLGACYYDGLFDVEIEIEKAVELFEQAITHDDPRAYNALAMLYRQGRGVKADPVRARKYAKRSAEAGFPLGQHQLAAFLIEGIGGEVDLDAGLLWLRKAIRQGWASAKFHLAMLLLEEEADAAPNEDADTLLAEACKARCHEALIWRADRELAKPDDQVAFHEAVEDLFAATEVADEGSKEGVLCKVKEVRRRLEKHLLSLPGGSKRYTDLSALWFQIDDDGHKKFSSPWQKGEHMFEFDRSESGESQMTDKTIMNVIRSQAGPAASEDRIQLGFRVAKAVMNSELKRSISEGAQAVPKVGRNEPCPCESGKKYKKCHGR